MIDDPGSTVIEVDCTTGEECVRPLTDDELADRARDREEELARQAAASEPPPTEPEWVVERRNRLRELRDKEAAYTGDEIREIVRLLVEDRVDETSRGG